MSSGNTAQFKDILATNHYHATKTREATFNLLVGSDPQSISQILARAKGTVSRVTIYRNIELFEKIGIVHRIYVGWKYKLELSDQFIAHHHHLSCLNCGAIIDIEDEKHIDEFIYEVSKKYGFQPRRHQFEVDGYCKNCHTI